MSAFFRKTFRRFSRAHLPLFGVATCTAFYTNSFYVQAEDQKQPKVWRILFTGGPCAGKSTALNTTRDFLTDMGYEVFIIEESATFLNRGNIKWSYETLPHSQYAITKMQTHFEDIYTKFAQEMAIIEGKPSIILMDRGIMDGLAYIDQQMFLNTLKYSEHEIERIGKKQRPNYEDILDRYDMVLHLVSAAKGAPEFYENEEYRSESVMAAIQLDDAILCVYSGHEDRRIIYSAKSFDEKIKAVISNICDKIDIPNLRTTPEKFAIHIEDNDGDAVTDIVKIIQTINSICIIDNKRKDDCALCDDIDVYYVERAYLNINKYDPNAEYTVIRKTVKLDYDLEDETLGEDALHAPSYTMIKKMEKMGQEISESTSLDQRSYSEYLEHIEQEKILKLFSLRFTFRGIWYEMEVVQAPEKNKGLIVLKLYGRPNEKVTDENGHPIHIPQCVKVDKVVTEDRRYEFVSLLELVETVSELE